MKTRLQAMAHLGALAWHYSSGTAPVHTAAEIAMHVVVAMEWSTVPALGLLAWLLLTGNARLLHGRILVR